MVYWGVLFAFYKKNFSILPAKNNSKGKIIDLKMPRHFIAQKIFQ